MSTSLILKVQKIYSLCFAVLITLVFLMIGNAVLRDVNVSLPDFVLVLVFLPAYIGYVGLTGLTLVLFLICKKSFISFGGLFSGGVFLLLYTMIPYLTTYEFTHSEQLNTLQIVSGWVAVGSLAAAFISSVSVFFIKQPEKKLLINLLSVALQFVFVTSALYFITYWSETRVMMPALLL